MSSQASSGRETSNTLAYLKVALLLLNDDKDEVDLKLGRPIRLEDLDNLTSENMLKIIMSLLRHVIGNKPISRIVSLAEFNRLGVGDVSYDCGIDVIYHAVKQIFPEDDEMFHYCVLLLPSKHPKRTRAVIAYIMEFVLMVDELVPRFQARFDDVLKENQDKVTVCTEIDELKESICSMIQERQADIQRLPLLQNEMERVEESIRKQQTVLSNLKIQLDRHKGSFEEEENRVKSLQQELERLKKDAEDWESKIVLNPNEIRAQNETNKAKLEAESKRRKMIGSELEKLRKDCDVLESLMGRANDVIQNFESVISLMNSTKLQIESYTKFGNELSQMVKKLEQLREESSHLNQQFNEKRHEVDRLVKRHEASKQKIAREIEKVKGQISRINAESEKVFQRNNDVKEWIFECKEDCDELKLQIAKSMYGLTVGIPLERKQREEEAMAYLELLEKHFCNFPLLTMEQNEKGKN